MTRTRTPLPPPPLPLHKRLVNRFKLMRESRKEFSIFIGVCILIIGLIAYNSITLTSIFSSSGPTGFDLITAHAGEVANTEHTIKLALFAFDGKINSTGISTTTVLSSSGTVLSSTLSKTGDIDILSNNRVLPHFIQFRSIKYRQINQALNINTSPFDVPITNTWTNDMVGYEGLILGYRDIINPSTLLASILPSLNINNSQIRSDGSTFAFLSGSLSNVQKSLSQFIPKTTLVSGAKVLVYVTLDKDKILQRVMIVFPDASSILTSSNGVAMKIVDKPDLTTVISNLHIKKKKR